MIQPLGEKNSLCWHTVRKCFSIYCLMRVGFSFLFIVVYSHCYQSSLRNSNVDFFLFASVVVLCALLSSDLSPLHLKLAAAGRFPPPSPPPCFFCI